MQSELFFGNYRGEVIRVDDPLEAGRVKVRVFNVYDDIPEDAIPWAQYSDPFMGGIPNAGSIIVPELGSHVWVFFEGGDHHLPVYWAGAPAMSNRTTPDIPEESRINTQYPNNKVFKTKAGFIIEVDDSEGATKLRVKHPSGNEAVADHTGNVTESITGSLVIEVAEGITLKAPSMQFGEETEPMVLGDQLANFFETVLKPYIDGHTHGNGNNGSPTDAPLVPIDIGPVAKGGSVYSKKNSTQ